MSDIAKQESRGKLISNFAENSERKKPEKVSIQYFQARLSLLERYWSEFYNAHSKLLEDSKADYFKNKIFDEIESDYIMNVATLQEKIDTLRNNSTAAGSPSNTQSVSSSSSNRRLPVLDVPKFSGKQQDWETFKELFCSIIKDDMKITPVEKLQHLLNCVEGPAASSLKGIKVTGTNFVVAWDKLLRRYDNRRIRLATHLDSLINLKYVSKKSATDINSLLDVADEVEKGLTDLGCPVVHYDIWFVHLITSKLDSGTREDWEISQEKCKTFSTYASLRKFLESRVRSLEQSQFNHSALPCLKDRKNFAHGSSSRFDNHTNSTKTKTVSVHVAKNSKFVGTKAIACKFCSGSHKLKDCDYFKRSTVAERIAKITQLRLCMNCLNKDHRASECPSTSRCFICDERHHVKLHIDKSDSYGGEAPTENVEVVQNKSVYFGSMGTPILLATAQINVMSSSGDAISVRALIDPGAEASFISEGLANLLCLPRQVAHVSVSVVGATKSGVARMKTYARLSSKINSEFTLLVPMLIMEKLTMDIPGRTLRTFNWSHLSGLALADPHFCKPSRIDCILGADVYAAILKEGVLKGPPNAPVAQETQFGWVLTGLTGEPESIQGRSVQSLHVSLNPSISSLIANFWEIEHIPFKPIKSEEDEFCEALYCTTTFRTPEGRYVVRLPVKTIASFPDSRNIALSCLNRLERRLMKQPNLKEKYSEFLQEYEDLGHMRSVSAEDDSKIYYLPHHSVLGSSGKLRVVFNASQKCGTGISLNDTLYPGPKLQQELAAVICRWRLGKFAFVCDTVKMFRQILVADEDLNLQRILWRTEGSNDLKEFQLLTVTYGTTPAPYLAIRTLLQLAEDEKDKYPDASEILRTQTYVDDILVSSDSLEESLSRRDHLISLLACAGISLSKWSASCSELLTGLSAESVNTQSLELDSPVSTLGLLWYPSSDCFTFKVSLPKLPSTVTKRSVLSEIAKLFDPLGWLGPVIIQGKILLQDLWLSGVDWDTTIPDDLKTRWLSIRDDLLSISKIHIPRWLGVTSDSIWEIHGFCDSSSRAYAASVYVKAVGASPFLLMAKTKVAPLKTLSIPRLELCGAFLLATLMHYLIPEMPISPSRLQCWTDSTVVLAWLNKHPSNWTTFVANRVSKIMELLPNCSWNYVSTLENPADCASRGMSSQNLKDFYLWWHGPVWLADSASQYPEGSETVFKTDLEVSDFISEIFDVFPRVRLVHGGAGLFPGGCQFKKSWQGRWFQSGVPNYLLINSSFIESKGECYEEQGDKFLVYDRTEDCYRCLVLHPKHISVLQYKETYCETKASLNEICQLITGDAPLYSLFRKHPEAKPIPCPFKSAPFTFSYNRMTGDCSNPPSKAESCTDDSRLVLKYQACPDVPSTESNVEELVCLATWKEGSTRYLIGKISQFNRRSVSDEDQYRCFIYQRSIENGKTIYNIAQSGDATCTGLDATAFEGSRTMKLTTVDDQHKRCKFPKWITDHHTWLSLDHHKTYRFSQRNATLKILDDDPPKPNKAQPIFAQAFAFEEFGFQSQDQKKQNSEMRVVCHGILQQQEQKKVQIVAHITAGCDSGYVCMVFYKRDSNVIEIQQTENYVENPDEACANFDPATAPFTTLITTTLHPKKCPHLGRYTIAGISTQEEKRKRRDLPEVQDTITDEKPDCVSNEYETLSVGCSGSHEIEFRSSCSQEASAYSCHGNWEENGISYVITSPVARKSTDALRYCFIYTLANQVDSGVIEGSLGDGMSPSVLRLSGISESCHRTIIPGVTGNWAFNFTSNGTCAESDQTNSSQLLLPTLVLVFLFLISVIVMR